MADAALDTRCQISLAILSELEPAVKKVNTLPFRTLHTRKPIPVRTLYFATVSSKQNFSGSENNIMEPYQQRRKKKTEKIGQQLILSRFYSSLHARKFNNYRLQMTTDKANIENEART